MKSFSHAGEPPVSSQLALQTPDNLLLFHRCPYCRRGVGDIHIDLQAAAAWKPSPSARYGEVSISEVPDQTVVVFQPGVVGANPCPHMIYLLVDVNEMPEDRYDNMNTFLWHHPRFDEGDPNGLGFDLLWEEVVDRWAMGAKERRILGPRSYRPSFPYRIRRPVREIQYPHHGDPEGRFQCEGWVICSVDAKGFCAELVEVACR
jgi:hypothetical protein